MKKTFLFLSLIASISLFAKIEKIGSEAPSPAPAIEKEPARLMPSTKRDNRSVPKIDEDTETSSDNSKLVQPVSNEEIRYDKTTQQFSLFEHDKKAFKSYIDEKHLPARAIAGMYHNVTDPESLALTAYAYDYAYGRPDLADGYYERFPAMKKLGFSHKIRYADFLLRTNQIEKIQKILAKGDCVSNFNEGSRCFYYLGVAEYLISGDNKNMYLRIAKSKQEKALELWNGVK